MPRQRAERWRHLDPTLLELVGLSSDDIDAMVDDVGAEISRQAAAERIIDPSRKSFQRMRSISHAVLAEFLLEVGNPDGESDRSVVREQGRLHQQLGGSVESLVGYYEMAGIAFWRKIVSMVPDDTLPVSMFAELGEALFGFASDLIASAVAGFVEANAEAASGFQAMRDRLLEVLLSDPPPDEATVVAASRAALWTPPERVVVGVLDVPLEDSPESLKYASVVAGSRGRQAVFVIPEDDLPRHRGSLAQPGGPRCALGPVVPLGGARESQLVALRLIRLAEKRCDPPGTLLTLEGNELDLMVAAQEDVAGRLASHVLAPLDELDEERRAVLMETLAAWLNRPDQPLAVAKEMHVHVQTVRYRLRQLRELLGDALDDPEQRARLALAVRARQLLAP